MPRGLGCRGRMHPSGDCGRLERKTSTTALPRFKWSARTRATNPALRRHEARTRPDDTALLPPNTLLPPPPPPPPPPIPPPGPRSGRLCGGRRRVGPSHTSRPGRAWPSPAVNRCCNANTRTSNSLPQNAWTKDNDPRRHLNGPEHAPASTSPPSSGPSTRPTKTPTALPTPLDHPTPPLTTWTTIIASPMSPPSPLTPRPRRPTTGPRTGPDASSTPPSTPPRAASGAGPCATWSPSASCPRRSAASASTTTRARSGGTAWTSRLSVPRSRCRRARSVRSLGASAPGRRGRGGAGGRDSGAVRERSRWGHSRYAVPGGCKSLDGVLFFVIIIIIAPIYWRLFWVFVFSPLPALFYRLMSLFCSRDEPRWR